MSIHPLNRDEFVSIKKNGIFVFHSSSCYTCKDHIQNLKAHVNYFYTIEYEEDVDFYIGIGIESTPSTIVYKDNKIVYKKNGMMFDTQINEMVKTL